MDIVGTLRLNRIGLPKSIKEAKLKKGKATAAYCKKLNCIEMEGQKAS